MEPKAGVEGKVPMRRWNPKQDWRAGRRGSHEEALSVRPGPRWLTVALLFGLFALCQQSLAPLISPLNESVVTLGQDIVQTIVNRVGFFSSALWLGQIENKALEREVKFHKGFFYVVSDKDHCRNSSFLISWIIERGENIC